MGNDRSAANSPYKMSTPELLGELGFDCQEHQVTTADGYVLVLHRVMDRHASHGALRARVPLLVQHGLMQDSEAWLTTGERSLPCILARSGFDVWLGNNRGNKYSCKHLRFSREEEEFWDFSLDDMARYDVPAAIDHIRAVAQHDKVAFVGFSQGSAQMFAALSIHPAIAGKLASFAALSAAVGVRGLQPSVLTSLIEADKNFLHLFFGRSVMMPQAMSWRSILSPSRYAWLIHHSVRFLFGWDMSTNITHSDCVSSFAHIYSYSSVKAVVHWFQIIRAKRFQVYMDDSQDALQACPPKYDVSSISTPLAVFVGGQDTVVDAAGSVRLLPPDAYVFFEPTYSHLDFKWARGLARPGRAFESLVAFLYRASPTAAQHASSGVMMGLFGSQQPKMLRNPTKLAADIFRCRHAASFAGTRNAEACTSTTGDKVTSQHVNFSAALHQAAKRSALESPQKDADNECSGGFVHEIVSL